MIQKVLINRNWKVFIGIKKKFKSIDDLMRTIPGEWLRSYLVTETRVEFIIQTLSQLPLAP